MDTEAAIIALISYTTISAGAILLLISLWKGRGAISKNRDSKRITVPFVTLHDPEWKSIGKALYNYEQELGTCLEGLSKSLELCLQTEASMGLEDGVMSNALRNKIDILSNLMDLNLKTLRNLVNEFPILKMIPEMGFQQSIDNTWFRTATTVQSTNNNDPPPRTRLPPTVSSYDSLGQIVAHLVRDWTQEGTTIRKSVYDWCRSQLNSGRKTHKILIPGAGLGRLAWDLAQSGNHVEANEVSITMAAVAYKLLHSHQEFELHPFLTDFFVNEVNSKLRYQTVVVQPPHAYAFNGHLSYTIGDFVELYGSPQTASYDIVITCFFLDTATNVLTYLAILSNLLPMGGQWIHVGPLQWHMNAQLHPSADELKLLVQSFGFRIDHWSIDTKPVDYRIEEPDTIRYTKFEGYQPLRMVATKVIENEARFRTIPEIRTQRHTQNNPFDPHQSTISIEDLPD